MFCALNTIYLRERLVETESAICLDPPPGGSAEPIMLRDMRPTYGTTLEMGRIASDASFGSSREHALPAAQRAALRCPRPARPPRGCSDLGLHGPPGSDATMMQLIPLRGPHHRYACWHRDASGSSRLHRVHHRQTQQRRPAGTAAARDALHFRISVAARARPGNQPLLLHLMHPRPRRRMFARPPARPSAARHANGPTRRGRGRHASQSLTGGRSWPGPATRLGRSVPVITNLGSSFQAPRSG